MVVFAKLVSGWTGLRREIIIYGTGRVVFDYDSGFVAQPQVIEHKEEEITQQRVEELYTVINNSNLIGMDDFYIGTCYDVPTSSISFHNSPVSKTVTVMMCGQAPEWFYDVWNECFKICNELWP